MQNSTGIKGSELIGTNFEKFAKDVLGKDKVTDQEIENLFRIDECFQITELNISASETRQVRPYESNNYFLGFKCTLENADSTIAEIVKNSPKETRVETYYQLRAARLQLIEKKYSALEDKARELISKQQKADGIVT